MMSGLTSAGVDPITHPLKPALAFLLCLACSPQNASEESQLADKVVAAYGGAEALEQNTTFRQTGTLDSYRHGRTGTIVRTYSRPDKLHVQIEIPHVAPEIRILNGAEGWRDGRPVPPMMARAMLLQAARLDLPYLIMNAGADLKLVETITGDDGKTYKVLELPLDDGLRLIAIVDAATGLIMRSLGLISVSPGNEMEFAADYADHQERDGIVWATTEVLHAMGQTTGTANLEQWERIKDLSQVRFAP